MKTSLLLFTCICVISAVFAVSLHAQDSKSVEDAQAEFDKMYGGESADTTTEEWRNEFTSISKFMATVVQRKDDKIFIIYGSDKQLEAVDILRTALGRKRGFGVDSASSVKTGVYPVRDTEVRSQDIAKYKAIIIGTPSDNQYIDRIMKKGKLTLSSTRAQFRLFRNPNAVAIACENGDMFTELVRVFLRSYPDFEDECYSYFYMN
ncbi:MAG: hypothetical protein V1913_06855 [Fibrobacterota bacterium]